MPERLGNVPKVTQIESSWWAWHAVLDLSGSRALSFHCTLVPLSLPELCLSANPTS